MKGNMDAATVRLMTKEIAEIDGKREKEPELVTAG
jgi:hypothetical protein